MRNLGTSFGLVASLFGISLIAGCGTATSTTSTGGKVAIVAAENEYGNVASQIGGRYVAVTSVISNPNTDPHTYEVSPSVAADVSNANLVIQNGLGYDDFMTNLENASSDSGGRVINVQDLLGLPDNTPNPHLWYSPTTMPKVASAIASDLKQLRPSHASYFAHKAAKFIDSLSPWMAAISRFRATYKNTPVATTEPVADYLLEAIGADSLTPLSLQLDIMNGVDPAPEDISNQTTLFSQHKVRVLVYNEQVTDSLTQNFISAASRAGIPIVGVYETMPAPGYDYQSWMLAEVTALRDAVVLGKSTEKL